MTVSVNISGEVINVIAELTERSPSQIDPKSVLIVDLDVDDLSLDIILARLGAAFEIEFDVEVVRAFKTFNRPHGLTVSDIIEYLESRLRASEE